MDLNNLDKGQLFWHVAKEIVKMTDEEVAEHDIPLEIAIILKSHYDYIIKVD